MLKVFTICWYFIVYSYYNTKRVILFKTSFKGMQMIKNSKIFAGCLAIGLASFIGLSNASDNVVLFKIHDVVPVKDAEGLIVSCDFGATFYNRSPNEVTNASLNLSWADEVVADAINQEARNNKEAMRANRRNTPRYGTATYNSNTVSLNLRLPPLKPNQQVSLKSKVATDRCFLLIEDMEINVNSCNVAMKEGELTTASANNDMCKNLFRNVGPKSSEYYSDFLPVSVEAHKAEEDAQVKEKYQEMEDVFNQASNAVAAIETSLSISSDENKD